MPGRVIGNIHTGGQPGSDPIGQIVNASQQASTFGRDYLGTGFASNIAGPAVYAGQRLLKGQNPLQAPEGETPEQMADLYKSNPFMTADQAKQTGGVEQLPQNVAEASVLPLAAYGGAAVAPLAKGASLPVRAGVRAFGNLPAGIAAGFGQKDATPESIAGTAGITSALSAILPEAANAVGKGVGRLAFGKVGAKLPEIGQETGKVITGLKSPSAKAAQQEIGQKIGDVYGKMGTGMTRPEVMDTVSDKVNINSLGTSIPTALDDFLHQAGVAAEDKGKALAFISESGQRKAGALLHDSGGTKTTGSLSKEFNGVLQDYLSKNPDIEKQVAEQGIDKVSLPAAFWQQLKVAIKPSQKTYDAIAKSPDYIPSVEDKIRLSLTQKIASAIKDKLAQETPQAAPELNRLNDLYSAITPITKGNIQPFISGNMAKIAPFMGGAALAAPLTGMSISPYLGILGAMGLLTNPSIAGRIASGVGTPGVQAAENLVAPILGKDISKRVTQPN